MHSQFQLAEQHILDQDITLRIRTEADAERSFYLIERDRAYLRRWLPWVDGTKQVQDCLDYILLNRKEFAGRKSAQYGIFFRNDMIGMIGYHSFDHVNRITSLGYWLASKYQGNGIMTKAAGHLTNYAFNSLHVNRVEIHAAVGNAASRAVAERLSFIREGVARDGELLSDGYVDTVTYARLARDA